MTIKDHLLNAIDKFNDKMQCDAELRAEVGALTKKVNIDLGTEHYSFLLKDSCISCFDEGSGGMPRHHRLLGPQDHRGPLHRQDEADEGLGPAKGGHKRLARGRDEAAQVLLNQPSVTGRKVYNRPTHDGEIPERGRVARTSRRAHNPETGRSNRPPATSYDSFAILNFHIRTRPFHFAGSGHE